MREVLQETNLNLPDLPLGLPEEVDRVLRLIESKQAWTASKLVPKQKNVERREWESEIQNLGTERSQTITAERQHRFASKPPKTPGM